MLSGTEAFIILTALATAMLIETAASIGTAQNLTIGQQEVRCVDFSGCAQTREPYSLHLASTERRLRWGESGCLCHAGECIIEANVCPDVGCATTSTQLESQWRKCIYCGDKCHDEGLWDDLRKSKNTHGHDDEQSSGGKNENQNGAENQWNGTAAHNNSATRSTSGAPVQTQGYPLVLSLCVMVIVANTI